MNSLKFANQFGKHADTFIAAGRHFGNKSPTLIKNYAENLGFEYISASNKDQFSKVYEQFINPKLNQKSMVFEVFTESDDETNALQIIRTLHENKTTKIIKDVLGRKTIDILKKKLRK